jgi:DNA-binding response OmpR family regulator
MSQQVILLVEDNASDEELTLLALSRSNVANKVIVTRDGAEALDYLRGQGVYAGRDTRELPQLVLLDLNLPKVSGMDVLRAIRADDRMKLLPVVILTSSKEEIDLVGGYASGANSYVVKPVDFRQFSQAVGHLGLYWLVVNQPPPMAA